MHFEKTKKTIIYKKNISINNKKERNDCKKEIFIYWKLTFSSSEIIFSEIKRVFQKKL